MYLNLNFRQLKAIIDGYRNGVNARRMVKVNPILKNLGASAVNSYMMYWRAGSFNQTIMDNARKLGFNPDKLISHECDDL